MDPCWLKLSFMVGKNNYRCATTIFCFERPLLSAKFIYLSVAQDSWYREFLKL